MRTRRVVGEFGRLQYCYTSKVTSAIYLWSATALQGGFQYSGQDSAPQTSIEGLAVSVNTDDDHTVSGFWVSNCILQLHESS